MDQKALGPQNRININRSVHTLRGDVHVVITHTSTCTTAFLAISYPCIRANRTASWIRRTSPSAGDGT
eukprot:768796-Hanusia_phi.AAC.2